MSTLPLCRRFIRAFLAALVLLLPRAVQAAPLSPTDLATLRGHIGDQVEVQGTPTATGVSKSGTIAYVNFAGAHQGLALVFFLKPSMQGGFGSEADLKQYVGKKITVSGKLEEYKGDLQIKVETTAQIKVEP